MNIFNNNMDYERFQKLLFIVNSEIRNTKPSDIIKSPNPVWRNKRDETLVDIGAYCLMPNHFHLLIRVKNANSTSKFIQRLQLGYSKYFNIKNDRTGILFQGKCKSRHIENNNYLKYIFSYIHLNPIKLIQKDWKEKGIKNFKKAKNFLKSYKYSSYLDFIEDRGATKVLEKSEFPDYFSRSNLFNKEIFEWLKYKKHEN